MFISAIFTTARRGKQPKWPLTNESIMKTFYVYTRNIIQLKKSEVIKFAEKCIELEKIIMSEINQTQKDKLYIISLFYYSQFWVFSYKCTYLLISRNVFLFNRWALKKITTSPKHRSMDSADSSYNGQITITTPIPYSENIKEEGREECKGQQSKHLAVKQSFLEMATWARLQQWQYP